MSIQDLNTECECGVWVLWASGNLCTRDWDEIIERRSAMPPYYRILRIARS